MNAPQKKCMENNRRANTHRKKRELFQTVIWIILIAFVVRTFLFQPIFIPSSSMMPNLLEGDYIITSKYSLGYGRYAAAPLPFPVRKGRLFERTPKRGDILVFWPERQSKPFVKRLIGLPGDKISLQDGQVFVDGKALMLQPTAKIKQFDDDGKVMVNEVWQESMKNGVNYLILDDIKNSPQDNIQGIIVPEGYYYMLGDNRDHSGDSRMSLEEGGVGLVPSNHINSRAEFVLFSAKPDFSFFKPWSWGDVRPERFFKGLR